MNREEIVLNANAKINLSLDVLRRRSDGYHEVELIYSETELHDVVTMRLSDCGGIKLSCSDPSLPSDGGNIAYRAAEMILDKVKSNFGAEITLEKNIPHGAGLGGGSADAAAVLKGINTLLGEPLDTEQLMRLGASLGADVPFCILGGCALGEGIGEILTPLPVVEGLIYVIVKPEESISTAYVYNNLDLTKRSEELSVKKVAEAIKNGDLEAVFASAGNIMESVTARAVPVVLTIKQALNDSGARLALMSGSGTSVFGVFEDTETAEAAVRSVEKYGAVYLTKQPSARCIVK